MTEAEWLAATDPTPMLACLREKATERKLRLFGVECCRLTASFLDRRGQRALATAERYADGLCTPEELEAARSAANDAFCVFDDRQGFESAANAIESLCRTENLGELLNDLAWEAAPVSSFHQQLQHLRRAIRRLCRIDQCRHLHCIFGNPFRPVSVDPAWLITDVRLVASGIYEEKAFERMPILADALQDAGCDSDELLNHLRGAGPHVRGCWALDLVLGKE